MEFFKHLDYTLLKSTTDKQDIVALCQTAIIHKFKAVCIPPYYVKDAVSSLEGHQIKTATVIGYPMGYATTSAKVEEIKRAIDEGADELDVVINLCAVKDAAWSYVKNDIESMTRAVHLKGKVIKVIIEQGMLNAEELKMVCGFCAEIGCDYVKTSTGTTEGSVNPEMITQLRKHLPSNIKIKASGGIRSKEQVEALINAGADRIGTSSLII